MPTTERRTQVWLTGEERRHPVSRSLRSGTPSEVLSRCVAVLRNGDRPRWTHRPTEFVTHLSARNKEAITCHADQVISG